MAAWIEKLTGSLEQKKQYREYKARMKALPDNYRMAAEAMERYLMYFGGIADGDTLVRMMDDFVNLFEQSAADNTPIRDIFGDDPVEFAETFLQNYSGGQWINKERERFRTAIGHAAGDR